MCVCVCVLARHGILRLARTSTIVQAFHLLSDDPRVLMVTLAALLSYEAVAAGFSVLLGAGPQTLRQLTVELPLKAAAAAIVLISVARPVWGNIPSTIKRAPVHVRLVWGLLAIVGAGGAALGALVRGAAVGVLCAVVAGVFGWVVVSCIPWRACVEWLYWYGVEGNGGQDYLYSAKRRHPAYDDRRPPPVGMMVSHTVKMHSASALTAEL